MCVQLLNGIAGIRMVHKQTTGTFPIVPQIFSVVNQDRSHSGTLSEFVFRPAGNDIGDSLLGTISIDGLVIPRIAGHVDMVQSVDSQFLLAPMEFFGPARGIGRTSRQNVGLQMLDRIPQDWTILRPTQVFEKGIGPDYMLPHGLFANVGSWLSRQASYAGFKVDQDTIQIAVNLERGWS